MTSGAQGSIGPLVGLLCPLRWLFRAADEGDVHLRRGLMIRRGWVGKWAALKNKNKQYSRPLARRAAARERANRLSIHELYKDFQGI